MNADRRQYHAVRVRVDELLAQGWSIIGREPTVLQRARSTLQIRKGMIING